MRKSYTKGTRWLIIFTLAMILGSYLLIDTTVNGFKNPKILYQEGNYFYGDRGYSIIKVLGIEELDLEDEILDEDEKFYMIESEHAFVILKSTREDLKKVIGDKLGEDGKLMKFTQDEIYARIDAIPEKTKGGRRSRTKINIKPELQEKFKGTAKSSLLIGLRLKELREEYKDSNVVSEKIKERKFYYNTYITPSGNGYHVFYISISLLVTILTTFMVRMVVKRIGRAKTNYENMFVTYPEVERDRDILFREAKYIDKKLKVLIYKDVLIIYKGVFSFSLWDDLEKISFKELISKRRVTGYSIVLQEKDDKKGFEIYLGGKKTKEKVKELEKYIRQNYKVKVSGF